MAALARDGDGAAFGLDTADLARFPLTMAHPVLTCGAIAAVALCSGLVFRESLRWTIIAGILLVVNAAALNK